MRSEVDEDIYTGRDKGFQKQDEAQRKERSVIFSEDDAGGRAKVTTDEGECCEDAETELNEVTKIWRLGGYWQAVHFTYYDAVSDRPIA